MSISKKNQYSFPSLPEHMHSGFTLIEVVLVLLVMTIIMGLAIPHLTMNKLHIARQEAICFRNVIERISDEAAFKGGSYRLRIDLAKQTYETLVLSEDEYTPVAEPLLKKYAVNSKVLILNWVAYETIDTVDELEIDFSTFGPKVPILMDFHLNENRTEGYSVLFVPGQKVPEVYQDIKTWSDFNRG